MAIVGGSNEVLLSIKTKFDGSGSKAASGDIKKLAEETKGATKAAERHQDRLEAEAKELARIQKEAREAAMGLRNLGRQDFGQLLASSRQVTQAFQGMRSAIVGGVVGALTALAGVSVGGAFEKGVEGAKEFEKNMAQVKLLTSATAEEVEKFRSVAQQMSRDTLTATGDLAKGFFVVQSAGVQGAAALQFTEEAAKAAAIGLGNVDDIVRAASTSFAVFQADGITASEAITGIAAAAKVGNFEVSELAGVMNRVVSTAKSAGATFDDVAGNIGNLSIYTGSASQSVEQLDALLRRFNQYSPQANKILAEMGTNTGELKKSISEKGLLQAMKDLEEQFKTTFGPEAATAIAATFQDENAIKAFNNLTQNFEQNSKRMQDYADSTKVSVSQMLDEFKRTDAGKLAEAQAALAAQLEHLGAKVLPMLVDVLRFVATHFEELQAVAGALAVVIGVGGVASAILALIPTLTSLAALIGVVTGAQWALNIAMTANPIGAIIALVALLAGGLAYAYIKFEVFRETVNALWTVMWELGNPIKVTLNLLKDLLAVVNGDWSFSNMRAGLEKSAESADTAAKSWVRFWNAARGLDPNTGRQISYQNSAGGRGRRMGADAQARQNGVGPVARPGSALEAATEALGNGPSVEDIVSGSGGGGGRSAGGGISEAERTYKRILDGSKQYTAQLQKEAVARSLSEEMQVRWAAAQEIAELRTIAQTKEVREQISAIEGLADAAALVARVKDDIADVKLFKDIMPKADDVTTFPVLEADEFLQKMREIKDTADIMAEGMAGAFGKVGGAFGSLNQLSADYKVRLAEIDAEYQRNIEHVTDKAVLEREAAKAGKARGDAEVLHNQRALSSFKNLFSEKTGAYRVLQGIEMAYQAIQIAGHVREMAMDAVATAKSIGNAIARGTADAAAGGAKIFSQLGVFGFPVVAAMVATLAALGIGALSGGGGGFTAPPTAEARQAAQGAGSVLGDPTAKSASLENALGQAMKLQNKELEYSLQMVRSLKTIESNIGAVASALASELGVNGSLSPDGLGLGMSGRPATLMNLGFGSTSNRTLNDMGLDLRGGALGDLISGGVSGNTFQEVIATTVKKAFGITYSNKTKTETTTGALDSGLTAQLTSLLASLRNGVLEAAGTLGVTGAEATLDAFQVTLGKLSFKDMTGEEIEAELKAVFGKVADDLSLALIPALAELQKVGEGAFETLARVSREYQILDTSLSSIGMSFKLVGLESLQARQRLIDLSGGIEEFADGVSAFAEEFLTDAERLAPVQAAVAKEMARLGLEGIATKDSFKALVLSLDTSTEAGAELFSSLMRVAPAFAEVANAAESAAQESRDLAQRQVDDAQSAVDKARSLLVDAYSRESGALQDVLDKFRKFSDSLKEFRRSLDTGSFAELSPEQQYRRAKSLFETTKSLALGGDERALASLQSVSEAYLNASRDYFASSEGYFADLTAVKEAVEAAAAYSDTQVDFAQAQLEVLKDQVKHLITLNESMLSVEGAIQNLAYAQGALAAAQSAQTELLRQQAADAQAAALAQAAAIAAAQGGGGTPATGGGGGSPEPSVWTASGYLAKNQDVLAEAERLLAVADRNSPWFREHGLDKGAEGFAAWHMQNRGRLEGRQFATGGRMTVGGALGEVDSQLLKFRASPGERVTVETPQQVAEDKVTTKVLQSLEALMMRAEKQRGAAAVAQIEELRGLRLEMDTLRRELARK